MDALQKHKFAADDWGLSPGLNEAVLELAAIGALHSVSLMANAKFLKHGLDRLLSLHKEQNFTLALHFNITEGFSTAPYSTVSGLVRKNGEFFNQGRLWAKILLGKLDPAQVAAEFRSQWDILASLGCEVSEINSHHHMHQFASVFRPIAEIARQRGPARFRVMRDPAHPASFWNARILEKSAAFADWRGRAQPLLYVKGAAAATNAAKIRTARFPLLIHPSSLPRDPDLCEPALNARRRFQDFCVAMGAYAESPLQPYWENKILRWEKARYSRWAFLNPFALTVRHRMNEAARIICSRFPHADILDLGCGSGMLASQLSFRSYLGMDFSRDAIHTARERNVPGARFELVDLTKRETLPRVDLVVMLGLTDWLQPDEVRTLFTRVQAPYILFSYTREQPRPDAGMRAYRAYRRFYDRNKVKPLSYERSFFEEMRRSGNFEEIRHLDSRYSPGTLVLWKKTAK